MEERVFAEIPTPTPTLVPEGRGRALNEWVA